MEPPKLVDIDNADPGVSENRTFSNSIESHSLIAEYYKFRPPYVPEFFQSAVGKLGVSKESVLLDLCCGRGELSSGLSEFCGSIFAVDGSDKMLENSIAGENIAYIQQDVNQGQLDLPSKVDHLVIGTAIHWVQQESLRRMVEQNLQPGAKIFVTHRLIRLEDQPYFAPLSEVDSKYGRRRPSVDLWGKAKLQACGYQAADQVQIRRQFKFGIEFIYKNQLSHLYRDFYLNVTDKFDEYRSDVYDALTPFLVNDRLTGTLVNWGIIHVPRAA